MSRDRRTWPHHISWITYVGFWGFIKGGSLQNWKLRAKCGFWDPPKMMKISWGTLADYDTPSIFGQSQMMIVDMGNTSIISILTSQAIPRCSPAESHCRIRRLSLQVDSQMLIAWNSFWKPTQKLFGNMVSPYIFLSCKTRNNDALVYNRECTVLILSLVCHCFGEPPFKKLGLRRDFP